MVSKVTAIALVLIVAVPILIGYGLAFEEVPYTAYETSDRVNVTDRVLNSSNPVYLNSAAPGNNSELLTVITYPGTGVTETTIKAPAYESVSSTYSSLPKYTTVSGYYELEDPVTYTGPGDNLGQYSRLSVSANPSNMPYIMVSADQLSELHLSSGFSELGSMWGPFLQTSGDSWRVLAGLDMKETGSFYVISDRFPTYTLTHVPYTDLEIDGDYTVTITNSAAIKITHTNDAVDYYPVRAPSNPVIIIKQGSVATIGDTQYSNVDMISVATINAAGLAYSYTQVDSGSYADPSYGWTTNVAGGNPAQIYWMNSQLNGSVRMLMQITNGEYVDLRPMMDETAAGWASIRRTSGIVTVNGESLGNYGYLCVDVKGNQVTVSGIENWPNMYAPPTLINSITVDLTTPIELFNRIQLSGSTTVNYRVDSAEILSGYFPTALNTMLDMGELWPEKSFTLNISSVGIFGTSLTFAGQNYDVTDGTITVDGNKIRIKDATFSAIYDEESGNYTPTINGIELNTELPPSPVAPALGLGGEWSLTIMAYNVEKVEGTRLEWQAGEWAWDGIGADFALVGLLTCGAVFVGLGMYGRRSGAKVGMLMLITGCAALIFLAMI